MPSLKKYSKVVPENDQADVGAVEIERTYQEIDDPEQKDVPEERRATAYNYGKQLVPVSSENEKILRLNQKSKKPSAEKKDGDKSGEASQ